MSDAESIEIKKRARRRLVGAVALALLAALILPMLMEQEPHPGNADIQISIPPRSASSTPPPLTPAAPPPQAAEVLAESLPEEENAVEDSPPPAPPAAASSAATDKGKAAEASAPPAASARTPAAPSEAERMEALRAQAAIEGRELPRGQTFVLQIGAFADAGKAAGIVKDLKAKGFPAYAETAGKVTRVRVGPLAGSKAAEKTAAELAGHGFSTVRIAR